MNPEPAMTAAEVAARVRPYVEKVKVGDITLWLNEAGIALSHNYWRLPISPSREPDPLFPYYEALANLEDEVQEKEGLKVSVASGNPLDEEE